MAVLGSEQPFAAERMNVSHAGQNRRSNNRSQWPLCRFARSFTKHLRDLGPVLFAFRECENLAAPA